ncbi:MAG: hypothetical protein ACJAZ9_001382 [Neolewinella sp.]|jgi:hypothetical protein
MFTYLAGLVEAEEIHSDVLVIAGPSLVGVQGDQITFGDAANEFDRLFRIFPLHPFKVVDEAIQASYFDLPSFASPYDGRPFVDKAS